MKKITVGRIPGKRFQSIFDVISRIEKGEEAIYVADDFVILPKEDYEKFIFRFKHGLSTNRLSYEANILIEGLESKKEIEWYIEGEIRQVVLRASRKRLRQLDLKK